MKNVFKTLSVAVALAICSSAVMAEPASITIGRQNGLAYMLPLVMEHQKFYEKRAAEQGIQSSIKTSTPFTGPSNLVDCAMAKECTAVVVGTPTVVLLNSRTKGEWKLIGPSIDQPMLLNTTNPNMKSIADITDKDKIAVPSAKTSVQAVTLQMAAAKKWGFDKATSLDARTVSMSHPDATVALFGGKSEVNSHFGAAPFQYMQLEKTHIHTVLNSYDVLRDGPQDAKKTYMFTGLVASSKWAGDNPKAFAALKAAYKDAIDWINADKIRAAKFFAEFGGTKEDMKDIIAQMTNPDIQFSKTPNGVEKYASFMNQIGTIKNNPTVEDLMFK